MDKRESKSRPQWGIVTFEHRARNQHGDLVMRARRNAMMRDGAPDMALGRLRRSLHFVPGGNERMIAKALTLPADGLILDLEDAVAPDRKAATRPIVAALAERRSTSAAASAGCA